MNEKDPHEEVVASVHTHEESEKRIDLRERYEHLRAWFLRYERRIASASLLLGFIIDNIMFNLIQVETAALALTGHLVAVAFGILLINMQERGSWGGWVYAKLRPVLPAAVQFSLGGLFSGFFIFYSRSGTLEASWPFLVILLGLLIGNEFLRRRYVQMVFQISIYYIALFLYAIFVLPLLLREMGSIVFILSGLVGLALIIAFLYGLSYVAPVRFSSSKYALSWAIGGIFVGMNAFYFMNIVPPIPLSLRDAGIYTHVERTSGGDYLLQGEDRPWYDRFLPGTVVHLAPGERLNVYSAVFAPSDLTMRIYHRWQYFNDARDAWTTTSTVGFPISGGRQQGYRGYTLKDNVPEGRWRVDVMTEREQIIGRVSFIVEAVDVPVPKEQVVK